MTLLVLPGCGSDSAEDAQSGQAVSGGNTALAAMPAGDYQVIAVRANRLPLTVPLGGTVLPRHELTIAAQATGKVVFLVGDEGTKVRPRELLVGLDNDALLARQRAAWATLAKATAALQNANVQMTRQLYGGGFAPRGGMGLPTLMDRYFTAPMAGAAGIGDPGLERYADINQSRVGVEQAQASVVEAQSALDVLDVALRDKRAEAPGPAVIIEKFVELGESVQPGQALLRIADTNDLQVRLDVPTGLVMGLQPGMPIPIRIDATKMRVDARLEQIFPAADPKQHTVTIKLALPPGSAAGLGMYATVMVPDMNTPAILLPVVPTSAVVWRGSQPSVFVVNGNNQSEMRLVRLGDDLGDSHVVLSGLTEGERIMAAPPAMMKSGMVVAIGAGISQ